MNNVDIDSYLLGIFDGEGCITASRQKEKHWCLKISVNNTNKAVMEMLQQRWGGGVYVSPGGPRRATIYTWSIGACKAIPFLEIGASGLVIKRRQAELALEIARHNAEYSLPGSKRKNGPRKKGDPFISEEDQQRREDIVAEIKSLNGRSGKRRGSEELGNGN